MIPNENNYLMNTTTRPDLVMVRGQGTQLWDSTGKSYLDFVQGWATNALGHAAPEIAGALAEQSMQLLTPSPAYHNRPALGLARRLAERSQLAQAYFGCTGADAIEVAIKLARKWGSRYRGGAFEIISTKNAFHGRTLAAMAASGKPEWARLFPPNLPGFLHVDFGDLSAMKRAIGPRTAALLVEPVQGEGGVVVPPREYLPGLRELADQHGVLLILDEVQTGLGRTGELFAHEWAAIRPDILTLGKGLGGGVPISATLANQRASCFSVGDQGGTFHGAPLACAVAQRVLDVIDTPEFLSIVRERGAELRLGLDDLVARHRLVQARGMGLLQAIVLSTPSAFAVRDECLAQGLLVNAPRDTVLRFMPSLRVSSEEVSAMLDILNAAIEKLTAGREPHVCHARAPS